MQFKASVFVVVCALAVVGCDAAVDQLEAQGEQPAADAGQVEPAPADVTADSGVHFDPAADAAVVLADASQTPAPVVDAGLPVSPVVEPSTPVPALPRCTTIFYADTDKDGYGDPTTALVSCSLPDGYVDNAADCYDHNALAKPGQTGRFGGHRGDGSFDYDCDAVERPLNGKLIICPAFTAEDDQCRPPNFPYMKGDPETPIHCYDSISRKVDDARDGWFEVVPACGQSGHASFNAAWSRDAGYTCVATTIISIQSCN